MSVFFGGGMEEWPLPLLHFHHTACASLPSPHPTPKSLLAWAMEETTVGSTDDRNVKTIERTTSVPLFKTSP